MWTHEKGHTNESRVEAAKRVKFTLKVHWMQLALKVKLILLCLECYPLARNGLLRGNSASEIHV